MKYKPKIENKTFANKTKKKSSYFQKLSYIIFIGLIVEMLMQMFLFCCQSLIYVEQKVIVLKLNEV